MKKLVGSLVLAIAVNAFGGFASSEIFLPDVGKVAGNGGSQFYTTVWVTNLGSAPVDFSFEFLQSNQPNPSPKSFADTLAAGETKVYEDIVGNTLELSNVNGGARITATGEVFASERIYNQPAGTPLAQTAGQFYSGIPASFAIGLGESASIQGVYLGSGEDFRYNYVLLETSGKSCTVHVQALDDAGVSLGSTDVSLSPYEQFLLPAGSLASSASSTNARITATVTAGTGTVILAGSQVGNGGPQDQSGFEMSFKDGLLGGGGAGVTSLNALTGALTLVPGSGISITPSGSSITFAYTGGGGSGLTAVTHDGTLTGDGSGAHPLGVNPASVVTNVNGIAGGVTLAAGSNVTITPGASTLTISASGGSGGVTAPLVLSGDSGDTISGTYTGSGGSNAGVSGSSASTTGFGVHGFNSHSGNSGYLGGPDYAVFGNSVNGAHGVIGDSTGGGHAGVFGNNSSGSGYGVNGLNSGSGDNGYLGGPNYGVFGISSAHSGVIGTSAAAAVAGVEGTNSVLNGWGVYGINSQHGNYGLLGGTQFGVYGNNFLSSGFGAEGIDSSGSGSSYGLYGSSANGYGVYGSSPSGYAGYFSGFVEMTNELRVDGNLSVFGDFNALGSQKNFVSPHPADPTKQIVYTCLEGPESGTYFRGSGRITGGFATIDVPESFRLVSSPNGLTVVATAVGSPASITVMKKGLDTIVIQGSSDVEFDFMVNGVRLGFENHETIQPNRYYIPRSAADDMATHMAAGTVAMLKRNGILNSDGSVNMETVKRLGWDRRPGWSDER